MRVFHSDRYDVPLPPGHRFPMEKYRRVRERLVEASVLMPAELEESVPVSREELEALGRHLPGVLERSCAEVLFYQAGVDPLAEDALGRLRLTLAGLRERDRQVLEAARFRGLPVVLTLGGGYAKPISLTVEAHVGTYEVARQVFEGHNARSRS